MKDLGLIAGLVESKFEQIKVDNKVAEESWKLRKTISTLLPLGYSFEDALILDELFYTLDPHVSCVIIEHDRTNYFDNPLRIHLDIPYAAFKDEETLKSYLDKELQ